MKAYGKTNIKNSNSLKQIGIKMYEGEQLKDKIRRMIDTKEPLNEQMSEILYTPKEKGVIADYNIRTDKWEVATEAMNIANQSKKENWKEKKKGEKEAKGENKTIENPGEKQKSTNEPNE